MSARAIKALRGDNDNALLAGSHDDDDDDDTSVEDEPPRQPAKFSSFVAMMESDDDEESSSSSDSVNQEIVDDGVVVGTSGAGVVKGESEKAPGVNDNHDTTSSSEEDLDDLIDQFRAQDVKDSETTISEESSQSSFFSLILLGLDPRDLDVDASMRSSLMGRGDEEVAQHRVKRGARQTFMFGPARDGWIRPPRYVGGGIGMATYDQDQGEGRIVPWPYNKLDDDAENDSKITGTVPLRDPKHWYVFKHSNNFARDCEDYKIIQQSGDLNALVMFVVHHPYMTDALLQLTMVLYQTNHSQEGLALLRRCLWIYECSALLNFTRTLDGNVRMDMGRPENTTFFKALFKLVHVSNIAGLPRTALAISRFLLSLDPLRDPMRVLVTIDHYALASNSQGLDRWLVELVESDRVHLHYQDEDTNKVFSCRLLEMPNWAYSYALALFRTSQASAADVVRQRADSALESALSTFPSVVGMLLQCLEVDTTGRSFRRDWVTVLDFATERSQRLRREWSTGSKHDPVEFSATMLACDTLIKIFVQQNARLWGDDSVLQWLYDNLSNLMKSRRGDSSLPALPSTALVRYAKCSPADFENRIQLLPQDANIINPEMLGHVLDINPNRPRFLRNVQRGGGPDGDLVLDANGIPLQREQMFGGPPTHVIDPDWPLVEVFWRSFLPWNRVEGVAPPRR